MGALGTYIGLQGVSGRRGTRITDPERSGRVRPAKSGQGAGLTGSGAGPPGPNRMLGRTVTGRGSRSPWTASGWHRSGIRFRPAGSGVPPGRPGLGPGGPARDPVSRVLGRLDLLLSSFLLLSSSLLSFFFFSLPCTMGVPSLLVLVDVGT